MAPLEQAQPRWTTTTPQLIRKVMAEMIGTFALVFAGCGAVAANAATAGGVSHVGVALTFGLVVMVMIYATGHISGAHFNPAVTLAFAAVGRFPWRQVPAYASGQVAASVAAAVALAVIFGGDAQLGTTAPSTSITITAAFGIEVVLTFFLMFVIISVATDSRAVGQLAGAAIGGTVTLCALFGGPLTGASMNPARSIGPAVVAGDFSSLWLYVLAPPLGAVAAAVVYRFLSCDDEDGGSHAAGCC